VKRVQVTVVGGGAAGLSAAIAAAERGAQTTLFDERLDVGGNELRSRADESGVDVRLNAVVWGLFAENILGVVEGETSYQVQADQVILSTGSIDLPCPFPGGSLPGVFTANAIKLMIDQWRILPGQRFVVIGDGDDADEVTLDIQAVGGEVVAQVRSSEVPRLAAFGDRGVTSVQIGDIELEADIVVVAVGRQPDVELALMAECAVAYSAELGGFVPIRDELLRTKQPSILVAGDAAGICDRATAMTEGTFAGVCAASGLGLVGDDELSSAKEHYRRHAVNRIDEARQLGPLYAQV
jgi:thioredoxin reductase